MATEDIDYYAVLDVKQDATLAEIHRAYRLRSLKVHPDRNPDNPQAAQLFHELSLAHDILEDPAKRSTFDTLLNARQARKKRFEGLDNKRKSMAEDLERREREWREEEIGGRELQGELGRLKEEGKKMREGKEKEREDREKKEREEDKVSRKKRKLEEAELLRGGAIEVRELGPLDTTIKLKWISSKHPLLTSASSSDSTTLLTFLVKEKGAVKADEVDSIVIAAPKKKYSSAIVALRTLTAAVRLVDRAGKEKWDGFEVNWVLGHAPEVLNAREQDVPTTTLPIPKKQPSLVPRQVDEASILSKMRAREAERARIEEEIRRQDEEDEAN